MFLKTHQSLHDPENEYQGYTNWATWNTMLWLGNDESVYRFVRYRDTSDPTLAEAVVRAVFPNGTPDMDDPKELDNVDWESVTEYLEEE